MTSERWKARLRLWNLSAAYKACFCDKDGKLTPEGERVLRDLGKFAGYYGSPVKVSPISRTVDPLASMVSAGRAEVVGRVWGLIDLDPTKHPSLKEPEDD
jgi:hypothetical protein